ncbi:MAG: hypothetical protein R3F49_00975 [Planctomycetota bacterium]
MLRPLQAHQTRNGVQRLALRHSYPLWIGAAVLLGSACRALDLKSSVGAKRRDSTEHIVNSPSLGDLDSGELAHPWEDRGPEVSIDDDEESATASRIGGDELIALNFRDVPLIEALSVIAARADVNMVLDPSLSQPINASFPAVKLDDAVHILLDRSGLELVEEPKGIFWVRDLSANGGQIASFSLGALSATDAVVSLQTLLGQNATIVADTNQNMVVVRGDRDTVAAARNFLERADKVKPQVLIEVHILEAVVDEQFEFGVAHVIQGSLDGDPFSINQGLTTQNAGLFSGVMSLANGDVRTTINALQDYVDLEIISTPRVLVVTNKEASIEVVEEVPYVETTTDTSTDGGASQTTQQTIAYKEAGIKLKVLPVIQDSGILQVTITKELSEVVGRFLDIPIIDKRTLSTEFMVADRQTIVLGGLMQDRRSDNETGVPLLARLPLVGRLFRRDFDSSSKRELLVFVTPRIVDPNEAAVLAKRFQNQYLEKRETLGFDHTR